ncbi:hypothetical protein BJF90_34805 [Pseudonocardia sp. CNS-004]|nr:hypothetical protein BJF90_34805 [Pseudonocardia sp. CNS-004]
MNGIRLGRDPTISQPERQAFVHKFRQLLRHSAFHSLDALGAQLRPQQERKRLSELTAGQRLPHTGELTQIVEACRRPRALRELQGLLRRAEDEEFASRAGRRQQDFQLARHAVVIGDRLPTVEEIRDWEKLGVHSPIRYLSSGQDLTDRVLAGSCGVRRAGE